jgi:hypothetical protein
MRYVRAISTLCVLISLPTHAILAADIGSSGSDCGLSLSPTAGLTEGDSLGGLAITQRCIRLRNVYGIQASCDSSEVAINVYCALNSGGDHAVSLQSSGIDSLRHGICLWSGPVDATLTITCKAFSKLKKDYSADRYDGPRQIFDTGK